MAFEFFMTRLTKGMMCLGLCLGLAGHAGAFSLIGPFSVAANGDAWQADGFGGLPQGLGYDLAGDIGGPKLPTEAYRWNVPVLTYAFDLTFLNYFGPDGVAAVEEAIGILNNLPAASRFSPTLTEYPLDTKGVNGTAAQLGLLDLKSFTLSLLLEQMGLANPERFVWGLRGRDTGQNFTNYSTVQLNYDPITVQTSRYVNGVLYNYKIFDGIGPQGAEWASAIEWYQLDPLYIPYSSVAGGLGSPDFQLSFSPDEVAGSVFGLGPGEYFSGLTRDDVGGLRYLLSTNHFVFDTLLPTVLPRSGGSRSSPWAPILSTNVFGTNTAGVSNIVGAVGTNFTNMVRIAYRPGPDKITFQRVGLFGTNFTPFTLRYTDRYVNPTTGRIVRQPVERLVIVPDIIFAVRDLGNLDEIPVRSVRSSTTNWVNNAALNSILGGQGLGGPGTIAPPIVIEYSNMVPYWLNLIVSGEDINSVPAVIWGSFDGTDRPPVVFPAPRNPASPVITLDFLREVALGR